MRLFFHQFLKDLRETWILWALWTLLTGAQFALAVWPVRPGDGSPLAVALAQAAGMLPSLHALLLFVLIPALLLQEQTVGVTAFWLTRPMPRSTVLGSKATALGFLFLLPLLGQCAVLLSHGILPKDVALAGVQIGLHEIDWISLAAVLAVLSPGFGRFIIVAVVFFTLRYFSGWLLNWIALLAAKFGQLHVPNSVEAVLGTPSLLVSRALVGDTLRIGFALGIVVFQYLTRRTRLSLLLAGIGLVASAALPRFWPWDFLKVPAPTVATADAPKSDTLRFEPGANHNINDQPALEANGTRRGKQMGMGFRVSGLDPRYILFVQSGGGTLALPGGKTLSLPTAQRNLSRFDGTINIGFIGMGSAASSVPAIEEAIGNLPLLNGNRFGGFLRDETYISDLFSLDTETYAAHAAETGTATFQFQCSAASCRIAAEVPLKQGAGFAFGSDRTTILDVHPSDDGVDVTLESRTLSLLLRPGSAFAPFQQPPTYLLVNRKRGEALLFQNGGGFFPGRSALSRYAFLNTLAQQMPPGLLSFLPQQDQIEQTIPTTLSFHSDESNTFPRRRPLVPIDAAWLADASLVRIDSVPAPSFEVPVTIPDFSLDGHTLPNWNDVNQKGPDLDALNKIVLPENPTRAQAWKYVLQILNASRFHSRIDKNDPEVEMLRKIAPAHADVLLLAFDIGNNYHIVQALAGLDLREGTPPGFKEMLFRLLPVNSDLIDVVSRNGWLKEAEPFLLDTLASRKGSESVHPTWVRALAALQDPATYDALLAYTEARSFQENHSFSYRDVSGLPTDLLAASLEKVLLQKQARKDHAENPFNLIGHHLRALAALQKPEYEDSLLAYAEDRSVHDRNLNTYGELSGLPPARIAASACEVWRKIWATHDAVSAESPKKKFDFYIPENQLKTFAALQDPSLYDALLSYAEYRALSEYNNLLFQYLRPLPGPMIAAEVGKIWEQRKGSEKEMPFLETAAEWGFLDALDRAAEILAAPATTSDDPKEKQKQQEAKNRSRFVFTNRTSIPGKLLDSGIVDWYAANKPNLVFDARLARFVLLPGGTLPLPQDAWPKPDDYMASLGHRAAGGDTAAIDEIDALMARITAGLDPVGNRARFTPLSYTGRRAFDVIGNEAVDNPDALKILVYANTKERLKRFVPEAYQNAVAAGNEEALNALLQYESSGWPLNDAISALWKAVQAGNPKAIDFIASVLADPGKAKSWNLAANCLKDPANAGNPKAKAAYEAWRKTAKPDAAESTQ